MRIRLPLRGVMAAVVVIAVGIAALRSASGLWSSVIFSAALMGLGLAAAYASQRRGPRRAFWSAFVAFGAGYLVLTFGPWCEESIRPRLLTTRLLDALFPVIHPVPGTAFTGEGITFYSQQAKPGGPPTPDRADFQDIGHSLSALLLGLVGATATRSFYANRDERRREAAEKAAGTLLRVLEAGL